MNTEVENSNSEILLNKGQRRISIRVKITVVFIFFTLLMIVVSSLITYIHYSRTMDDHYKNLAANLAETGANSLDPDMVARYSQKILDIYTKSEVKVDSSEWGSEEFNQYVSNFQDVQKDPDYETMYNILSKIRTANGIESIYITYVYAPDKIGFYIVDGSDPENTLTPGIYDKIYEGNEDVLTNPEISFPAYISNTDEYGWLASAGRPIYSSDGSEVIAHVLVDISMNSIMNDRRQFIGIFILIMVLFSAMTVFGIIAVIKKSIIFPIKRLSTAAHSYVEQKDTEHFEDNTNHFESLGIKTGDEIEDLSVAMIKMESDINQYIKNLGEIMADRERVVTELNVATRIQANMLPSIFPAFPDIKGIDIYATMNPAKEVGGDFYDFFEINDDKLGLVMADVSGKGVPAALFMVIAKTLIKNYALQGYSPSEVLRRANVQLCEGNNLELFVTVWIAIIDIKTGHLLAANAGHEHPAVKKSCGEYELVKYRHSPAVAVMDDIPFKEHEYQLEKGDMLFVYTDGVTEATDSNNCLFGEERLLDSLNSHKNHTPMELLDAVRKDIDKFTGDAPQFDDITMMAFYYEGQ